MAGVVEELFEMFEAYLRFLDPQALGAQIIVETLVLVSSNSIPVMRISKSKVVQYLPAGMSIQIDCSKIHRIPAGLKA
jgi:hypothetical protein